MMTRPILIALFILILTGVSNSSGDNSNLYPVMKDFIWGFIDNTGKVVIEPQYVNAYGFHEGFAAVATGELGTEKYGFINVLGNMVIPAQFDKVDYAGFSNGLACVRRDEKAGGAWEYISITGETVIPAKYDEARAFTDKLAPVRVGDKWGYIDRSGKMIIQPQYTQADIFVEGLARVQLGDKLTGKWGFINTSGVRVVEIKYHIVGTFSEGAAWVRLVEGENVKRMLVNKEGGILLSTDYDAVLLGGFSEGLAPVAYIDESNPLATTGYAGPPVLWGFIDRIGTEVIKPQFAGVGVFSEGLAPVQVEEKGLWGYINTAGTVVIEPQFDDAAAFVNGVAEVYTGGDFMMGMMGYIDKSGEYIWEPSE